MKAITADSAVPPEFRPAAIAAAAIAIVGVLAGLIALGDSRSAAPLKDVPQNFPTAGRKLPLNVSELPFETATPEDRILRGDPGRWLSKDAAALLDGAAAQEKGELLAGERDGKFMLRAGDRVFCDWKDGARDAARWREALAELVDGRLVEYSRGVSIGPSEFMRSDYSRYRLTARGFRAVGK